MSQIHDELSCFSFPYFLIPDELLKVAVLYFDRIYVDEPSHKSVATARETLVKDGPFAPLVRREVQSIEKALRKYEKQVAIWKGAGLLDSGIVSLTSYQDRIDCLPHELMDGLWDSDHRMIKCLPTDVSNWLTKRRFKIWHTAGAFEVLATDRRHYDFLYDRLAIEPYDERMPVEIEEEFRGAQIPDHFFKYRSNPRVEASNALRSALLKSVVEYGANNCFMPAYLPFLIRGITPWIADSTAERLLTHHFPHSEHQQQLSIDSTSANVFALKALKLALPSLSFRSYEEVLEARYLCRDTLTGYRHFVSKLVSDLETDEKLNLEEQESHPLLNEIQKELKDLRRQIRDTKSSFLRDSLKRASPLLTTLGLNIYMNAPLVGVIGSALGATVAMMISAYEARLRRKELLFGERSHGLSFVIRLEQRL